MYSKYAYGVPDSTTNEYDFLVNHGSYDTGVQLRNDTTSSSTGKKGVRISHSSTENALVDLRAATGAVNSFSFRLQDDSSPSSFSNMMVLTDDNKSSTSAYGMQVGGRVKASQYFIGESDTRAPTATGLYLGQDATTKGYFNMNPGASGTGGFKFSTFDANGQNEVVNLSLDKFGYAKMPKYSATNNALDTEASSAIVTVNSAGQLVRDYQQNARLRSSESRATNLENTVLPTVSTKVNEIISRMNAVVFFNSNIAAMDLGAVPLAYTAPAASVSLNMNVDLTTANSPTFQQNLIQSTADSLNISSSLVSIGSITSATGLRSSGARFKTGSGVNIEIIIAPDPTGTVTVNPQVAVQQLAVQAQSPTSPFVAALTQATGSNPVNTDYVPVVKVVPTNTPTPTTPVPTTPAPTTAPTTPVPTTPPPVTARYIKLNFGSDTTTRYFNLKAIRVYNNEGYNVITSTTPITVSSSYSGDYLPANLLDTNEVSYWLSTLQSSPWIQIDLGSDMNIYKVEVTNREKYNRNNGMIVQCINNASTTVYTSLPVFDKSGLTTYTQAADSSTAGYRFFTCWPSKSTTMYCTDDGPSYTLDPNVVTVQNYTGSETVINKYGALSKIWTAPVDCKLLSVSYYASGAVNNGGFGSGAISGPGWANDIGGHTWPTTVGLLDFYELINIWKLPTIPAGGQINFTINMVGGDRYFQTLQLAGSDLPVKFSYIPVSSIITPAPPTYTPAIISSTYHIKWSNANSGGNWAKFTIEPNNTSPAGTNIVTSNPTGDMYTLPAGTYSWTASCVNATNDYNDVTFFDPDANSVIVTLITGVGAWGSKSGSGTFTLDRQRTFQCQYTWKYYSYNSNFDITLTRQ
jgi:F5/8 type C domain